MAPISWLSVLLFLLLVGPGLLFDLLSARRRASASESAFREVGRVVLASLVFSAVGVCAVAMIAVAGWSLPGQATPAMPSVDAWIADPRDYLTESWRQVVTAVAVAALVSHAAVLFVHLVALVLNPSRVRPVSAWTTAFRAHCPTGLVPFARVRMDDGTVYIGRVGPFSPDFELEKRELVLVPPLYVRAADQPLRNVPPEQQRLVLQGPAMVSIMVQYRPPP